VGENVAAIEQLAVTARELPQVFELIPNALALAPPSVGVVVKFSTALPVLVIVTLIGDAVVFTRVLGKVTAVAENVATGAIPLPPKDTVCGLPEALSATFSVAPKVIADAGVKVTVMVHVAEAASVAPQVLDSAKSVGFVPVIVMPVIVRVLLPGLDNVVDNPVAVVPTNVS